MKTINYSRFWVLCGVFMCVFYLNTSAANTKLPRVRVHEILDGWLKEEIEQFDVIGKLGVPSQKGKDVLWDAIGTYVQQWRYPSKGITLEMESHKRGARKHVLMVTIEKPCPYKTSQGIGIGTNYELVRKRYASVIDTSASDETSIVVGTIYGGTIFTFENGVVSRIFLGAAAE